MFWGAKMLYNRSTWWVYNLVCHTVGRSVFLRTHSSRVSLPPPSHPALPPHRSAPALPEYHNTRYDVLRGVQGGGLFVWVHGLFWCADLFSVQNTSTVVQFRLSYRRQERLSTRSFQPRNLPPPPPTHTHHPSAAILPAYQNTRDDVLRGVQGKKEVQLFLDDPNTTVLCVRTLHGGGFRMENHLGLAEGQEGNPTALHTEATHELLQLSVRTPLFLACYVMRCGWRSHRYCDSRVPH